METQKTLEALNSLITINNDRIEGYLTAINETDEHDLKKLFEQFISTSQKNKQELTGEVTKLGGEIAEGTLLSGKFYRACMDIKAAFTNKDIQAILNSCEYGEEAALNTYRKAIKNNMPYITTQRYMMFNIQQGRIKADQDKVKAICNALSALDA